MIQTTPDRPLTLHLVSCVSVKLQQPSVARDLYVSPWFRKARAVVERSGNKWFILSAKHGLLAPEEIVAPYEQTLNTMRVAARRAWGEMVIRQFDATGLKPNRVVMFAGSRDREFLVRPLSERVPNLEIPMEGLAIGQQLAWLGRQT